MLYLLLNFQRVKTDDLVKEVADFELDEENVGETLALMTLLSR